MLFNSYEFLFAFFPMVLLGFYALGRRSAKQAATFLALASIFFYGWWSASALPLLLASIAFNYRMGLLLAPGPARSAVQRKRWLQFALVVNLGLLGMFKYADFFVANINLGLQALGADPWSALHWLLPIGISFYTFTQIAYLVDSWQGKVKETRFVHYLLFVTYFPHLIAGPVLHHAQMMPQFARGRTYRLHPRRLVLGLGLFVLGLSKKLLIADPLGQCADLVFARVQDGTVPSFELAWTGVLAYTFQIYFDFSGYSDMAVGLSRCLGVTLPENFRSPYKAGSIIEFWRRWHISLSNFLRDYLYIPLGGNRFGAFRRHLNLLLTMLLGGLWHGAAWTFVLWGAIHGLALVVNHLWRAWWAGRPAMLRRQAPGGQLARFGAACVGAIATFGVVTLAWVVFRAPDLATALSLYRGMLGLNDAVTTSLNALRPAFQLHEFYRTLIIAMLVAWALPRGRQIVASLLPLPARVRRWRSAASRRAWALGAGVAAGLLLAWNVSRLGVHSPFLYFQF
ncbi:MAG: MBOAT family O-acyltransferase [Burkholderiales bacterium]